MRLRSDPPARVRAVPVDEPLVLGGSYDYADAFTVGMAPRDPRTAEQWTRRALGEAPRAVQLVALVAQRRVLGLRLGDPADPATVLGWRVAVAEPALTELRASSPLLDARLVVRTTDGRLLLTTAITYRRRRAGRAVWALVAPLHRAVARFLLWYATTPARRPR